MIYLEKEVMEVIRNKTDGIIISLVYVYVGIIIIKKINETEVYYNLFTLIF
jgi:uncharacterized lipoprotein YehR (DUF1307 family)